MARIRSWKTIALASVLPMLIALQPFVTHACSGSHGGC